jgi:hypothetical protein
VWKKVPIIVVAVRITTNQLSSVSPNTIMQLIEKQKDLVPSISGCCSQPEQPIIDDMAVTGDHHLHSSQTPPSHDDPWKTWASMTGNILEWYDFAVFGYFSDILGQVFFPPQSGHCGILCRILGGILDASG